jgi:hypothetical protein
MTAGTKKGETMVSSPVEAAAEIREPGRPRTGALRWQRRIAPLVLLALGLGARPVSGS